MVHDAFPPYPTKKKKKESSGDKIRVYSDYTLRVQRRACDARANYRA